MTVATPGGAGEDPPFLGSGMAFPPSLDATGRFRTNSGEDHVRQSIQLILATVPGERAMRPDFGTGLDTLVFAPASAATLALLQHTVQEQLTTYEPRIDVLEVAARLDDAPSGRILVEVTYRVRRTDTVTNLVHPFYLERGTGGTA
jgi:phage baseplate assembly protein W